MTARPRATSGPHERSEKGDRRPLGPVSNPAHRVPVVYPRGRTTPKCDGPPRPPDLGERFGRTPPDGLDEPTDQKVGGSSPFERAYSSWSEPVSYGSSSRVGVGMTATGTGRSGSGRHRPDPRRQARRPQRGRPGQAGRGEACPADGGGVPIHVLGHPPAVEVHL